MSPRLLAFLFCMSPVAIQTGPVLGQEPVVPVSAKNVIVYYEPGRFCGWPANNGLWSWGDEILVGFTLAYYKQNDERHSLDREKPRETVLARSVDGGESWSLERPEAFHEGKGPEPIPCPGGIQFQHPDFAMRLRNDEFQISYSRGKSWGIPYQLPDFGQIDIMPRTDYLVLGPNHCLIFLTATKRNGKEGRVFMAETQDAGKTINFISWIGPEPAGFSIMPSSVQLDENRFLTAIRRYNRQSGKEGWIEVYLSEDRGRHWAWLSKVADTGMHAGNPPSMIRLADGRIAITYARRSPVYGIRARISSNGGEDWGEELVLRGDASTWDIGYTRSLQRSDGRIVTVYYYSTQANPEQHIAATIWNPYHTGE